MKQILFVLSTLMVMLVCTPAFAATSVNGEPTINRCETKSYTISVKNDSGNPMTNLVIVARLDYLTGFSYVSGTTSIDFNGGGAFCTANPAPGAPYLTWDIDSLCGAQTLNNGNTLNITFSLETDCTAVSGSLATSIDYDISGTPNQDIGALIIQVNPGAVAIRKTPNVIPQVLGQDVTWTLTVENTGFGVIENVEVTDELGAGLAYVSSTQGGNNSGQTTTWTSNEYAALASMNPGDILTMDITATVIAGDNLDNNADVRFGCNPSPTQTCFDTSADGGTARASVQRISRTPNLTYTPPDITFDYCVDLESVGPFTITNVGDGAAFDVKIVVDFSAFTVSNVTASPLNFVDGTFAATYNAGETRFEVNADPSTGIPAGGQFELNFDLTYTNWCSGGFPAGDILWQNNYKDECDNEFFPTVQLSAMNEPANTSSLSVDKTSGPATVQIGAQVNYTITSSYSGALSCGSGSTSDITVVDTIPNGFTVVTPIADGGVWVPGGGGTGGTITWTYTPPASLNTGFTLNVPDATQCETYCYTTFTNNIQATGTDCCGCALSASASQTTAIECEELVDSEKTAVAATGIRCDNIQYTNTYVFADNAALDSVNVSQFVFQEDADNEQEYVPGSLAVTLSGVGDITACATSGLTDTTPGAGGNLIINFSGCSASVRNRTLTITYRLTITEATVGACNGASFYSWSSLDMNLITGSQCLPDGIIHETTVVSVDTPAMSVSITGLGQIVHKCESQTITITLTQTSSTADPRDVRLVLSGLNYYVVNPAATICGGVAPVSCTPAIVGDDYVWEFGDAFTGSGQSATLQLDVQKRCTSSGALDATAYFDDNCNDDATYDDTCSVIATEWPVLLSGDLLIEKTPETHYAVTNQVQWEIYVTNRGTGNAYNVWVDDVLGSGLLYEHGVNPVVVDNMTGVTINDSLDHHGGAINGASIEITSMAAGERRQITFIARQIDCSNLTNDVSASWGCIGVDCQTTVTDNSIVNIPAPNLINTISTLSPISMCEPKKAEIALENVGQTNVYELVVSQTLPAGLTYGGDPEYQVNGGGWIPAPAPNPVVSPLVWSYTQDDGDTFYDYLLELDTGDILEIRFDIDSTCTFESGTLQVETEYKNPCGDTVSPNAVGTYTLGVRYPDVSVTKTRISPPEGDPLACGQQVQWQIVVENTGTYDSPVVWVEDTMDPGYTFVSSTGGNDGGFNGYGGNPLVTTWEILNLNVGQSTTLTLTADSLTAGSADCEDVNSIVEAFTGCGGVDGNSATKPGVDTPDNLICLDDTAQQDTHTYTPTRQPDLGYLSIAFSPGDIDACNDSTQLTIVMENIGLVDAYTIDLAVTLPTGITYNAGTSEAGLGTDQSSATAAIGAIGDPALSGSTITFYDFNDKGSNLAAVIQAGSGNDTANDTLVLRFTVQSACYLTDNLDFDLRFYDCCDDTQYSETTSQTLTANSPDLAVTKTANFSQVDCGSNVEYTIRVTNNGTGNAEVIRVVDTLGDWLDYAGNFTEDQPGNITPANIGGNPQIVGWEFNDLGSGATATFTFEATLNPDGLPNQNDCTAALRQNNVSVQWACGTSGDATDDDPNTTGYDCTNSGTANAGPVTLQMPNLVVTSITPDVTCTSDGSFSGTISVRVTNNGDGDTSGTFTVEVTDGKGWTGTNTYGLAVASGGFADVTIDTGTWTPDCQPCAAPYSFNATVDLNNDICECDESDSTTGSATTYIVPIPDLTVTDIDFSNVDLVTSPVSGWVNVTVHNSGCIASNEAMVALATDGCLTFSDQSVSSLAAGASEDVSFPISGSWDGPVCAFTATADPADAINECDGGNNTRSENFGMLSVLNANDSGAGSLRQAIADAQPGSGVDLSGVSGAITLLTELVIDKDLFLKGPGIIDGNNSVRCIHVASGADVLMLRLTLQNGDSGTPGGGVLNEGTVTITESTIHSNDSTSGIENQGTMTLENSTVANNAGAGISNSTGSTLTLNNVTIAENTGAGVNNAGTLNYSNTIVANSPASDVINIGAISDNTNNLVHDGSGDAAFDGDPLLGSLADNGGPTLTMALNPQSPAIDNADPATALSTDQRGQPAKGPRDIGAFEYEFVDFGDLPDGYGTLLASNGAFHRIDGVTYLGLTVDPENDGQPDADALGDDNNGASDDEDGVTFGPVIPGAVFEVDVTASTDGYIFMWCDFNGSGSWDAGELVFDPEPVVSGSNLLLANAPSELVSSTLAVRVRFVIAADQISAPVGYAPSGEVEDYMVAIIRTATLSTSGVSNIYPSKATCGGDITADGGSAITARGLCWSTSHDPTILDSLTNEGAGTGSFTSTMTGLKPNTRYYVRAYATNGAGTSYGDEETFMTSPATLAPVNIMILDDEAPVSRRR
ncbi:MAG: choice-of-anchor Q domain-containing protein [Thermodesulfobacteriota bacterium]|nr:choice-of-anchor Q domain-containing protein [Thermodesulfobacteriota bacterium]